MRSLPQALVLAVAEDEVAVPLHRFDLVAGRLVAALGGV